MRSIDRVGAFLVGVLFSLELFAAATVETVSGDVRAGSSSAAATGASKGQRILPGTVVTTGPNSQATLRFDDGQAALLSANTEFRVAEYRFTPDQPANDLFVFDLLKGAMRSVTAFVNRRTPQSYRLRIPQATIGIRGTDFMVAVVNPGFVSVLGGEISVANSAGTASFGPGLTGTVASTTSLATAIPASALPAAVAASFSQLSAVPLAATAGAEAAAAATGGLTPATAVLIGIGAAVIGVIANDNNDTPSPPSGTAATGTR